MLNPLGKPVIDLEKYAHTADDIWRWRQASGSDTQDIVDMALVDYGKETDKIFKNEPLEYSRNVTLAIVNQFYNPKIELFSVATDVNTGTLLAYTWAKRGERSPWSSEEMVGIRMAHVNQHLSSRNRVFLCAQMIRMWEVWARACEINIICSSTVRSDQQAFLKLHESAGYDIRGSICYKRLNQLKFNIEDSNFAQTFLKT
jgi:hypothetical protein